MNNENYKELANNLTDEVVDLRIENEKLKKANKELTQQCNIADIVEESEQLVCGKCKEQLIEPYAIVCGEKRCLKCM